MVGRRFYRHCSGGCCGCIGVPISFLGLKGVRQIINPPLTSLGGIANIGGNDVQTFFISVNR